MRTGVFGEGFLEEVKLSLPLKGSRVILFWGEVSDRTACTPGRGEGVSKAAETGMRRGYASHGGVEGQRLTADLDPSSCI